MYKSIKLNIDLWVIIITKKLHKNDDLYINNKLIEDKNLKINKKLTLINMNEISNIQKIWNMIYISTFFTEIQKNKLKNVLYNICIKFINYLGICNAKTYKNYQNEMNKLFKDFIIPVLKSKYNLKVDGFIYHSNNRMNIFTLNSI